MTDEQRVGIGSDRIGGIMKSDDRELRTRDEDASGADFVYRSALRLGFRRPGARRHVRTIAVLALVTWVPLVGLSWAEGVALGPRVEVPLLRDPVFYSRYVIVLPLLVLSEVVVGTSLAVQTGYLLESGVVPDGEHARYQAAEAELKHLYDSRLAQGVILVFSYVLVITFRTMIAYSRGTSSWERLAPGPGGAITAAGWWSILVCLPALLFLLLRWLWRTFAWAWFLFRVSRIELELTPTHPDRAGGLAFLTWGQASFAPILAGVSAVLSGSLASEVLYAGESLNSLKYHYGLFIASALAFLLAPLLLFSRQLARCRFRALLDFGMLAWRHDRAFDGKWLRKSGPNQERLLGSSDLSSLAAVGVAFEHVERMRVVPLDREAVIVLVLAAVVPLLPFLATAIPLADVLKDLAEFMV
jgi:hypothetical protein